MPRVRKVPLVKGPKRVIYDSEGPVVVRSVFCGECNSLTQSVTIQVGEAKSKREGISRIIKIAVACRNSEKHKDGKNYLWPFEGWILPRQ